MYEVVRILVIVFGTLISAYLLVLIARNVRRLKRQIEEYKAEQEAQGGAKPDPYMALAELYAEDARKNAEAKRKRGR